MSWIQRMLNLTNIILILEANVNVKSLFLQMFKESEILNRMILCSQFVASAHTGDHIVDEYPDISGITTARVCSKFS